jgi:hypothetical protein
MTRERDGKQRGNNPEMRTPVSHGQPPEAGERGRQISQQGKKDPGSPQAARKPKREPSKGVRNNLKID